MKIIDAFLFNNRETRDGKHLVKRSALAFLGCSNDAPSNTAAWIDSTSIKGLPNLDFSEADPDGTDSKTEQWLQDQIEDDMERSLRRNVRDFFYDFVSYGVEPMRALKKARTQCLMVVVEKYCCTDENWERIYKALRRQKVQGELRCNTLREFYFKAKWYMRRGLSEQILMSEMRWAK